MATPQGVTGSWGKPIPPPKKYEEPAPGEKPIIWGLCPNGRWRVGRELPEECESGYFPGAIVTGRVKCHEDMKPYFFSSETFRI